MIQTTQEELELLCARFFPVFQEYLRRRSIATGNIELAVSLDGVYSLPALYDLGGVQKTVRVPMKLLTRDVDAVITNCTAATAKAETAASNATAAAKKVTDAITDISREKQAALDAATSANTAKTNADTARVRIEGKEVEWTNTESSREAAEAKRVTAENSRVTAETVRANAEKNRVTEFATIKKNAETATANANTQAGRAKEQADNPPKMGDNGNWWKWDEGKKAYVDTGILAKGGVLYPVFSIKPETMELEMSYQDEIAADMFAIDNEGNLTFNPK